MIRDITIGQYYAADSIIHKLDRVSSWQVLCSILLVCLQQMDYLLSASCVCVSSCDSSVNCSIQIYGKRIKEYCNYSFDYSFF